MLKVETRDASKEINNYNHYPYVTVLYKFKQ